VADLSRTICDVDGSGHKLVPFSQPAQQEWGLQQEHGINSNVTEQALLCRVGANARTYSPNTGTGAIQWNNADASTLRGRLATEIFR
jgi:hypothetical protein